MGSRNKGIISQDRQWREAESSEGLLCVPRSRRDMKSFGSRLSEEGMGFCAYNSSSWVGSTKQLEAEAQCLQH